MLSTVSKAIAGAIVSALVALALKHGVVISGATGDALTVVLTALFGFVGVYLAPKNKP